MPGVPAGEKVRQDGDSKLPRDVRAWGLVSLFSDLSHEAATAVLPAFVRSLGGTPAAMGLIEGIADGASTFAKLWAGRIADRARRPKLWALAGYVTTALAVPAMGLARSWPVAAILRALGWLGRGFRSPLRDTLLVRAVPAGSLGRAFGIERALDQTGAVLAPLAAAGLLALSLTPRAVIFLTAIPAAAALAVLIGGVRDLPAPRGPRPGGPEAPPASSSDRVPPAFRRFLAAVFIFGAGDFSKTLLVFWILGGGGPEGSGGPGLLAAEAVLLYAGFNLVSVLSAYACGTLSDRWGRRRLLASGYLSGVASAAVAALAAPGWLAGLSALALAGWLVGCEEAVERSWASDLAGGRHGRAFGLLHAVNGIGDLVASAGVGFLWSAFGPQVAFGGAAAAMAAGTLLLFRVPSGGH